MSYEEKRVRVAAYGTVAKGSPLLVKVPGVGGTPRLLHTLAAKAHAALSATPSRSTRDAQRKTPLHAWLVERASDFGWHPYKIEPWHWEFPLSRRAWESGRPDPGGALPVLLAAEAEDEHAEPCEDEIPEEP